jgi:hypothetical protein
MRNMTIVLVGNSNRDDMNALEARAMEVLPQREIKNTTIEYLTDAFSREADELCSYLRTLEEGHLVVFFGDKTALYSHVLTNFLERLYKDHVPVSLKGRTAWIAFDAPETIPYRSLAKQLIEKLRKTGAEIVSPMFLAQAAKKICPRG